MLLVGCCTKPIVQLAKPSSYTTKVGDQQQYVLTLPPSIVMTCHTLFAVTGQAKKQTLLLLHPLSKQCKPWAFDASSSSTYPSFQFVSHLHFFGSNPDSAFQEL